MTRTDRWRKSAYSGNEGSCVEVDYGPVTALVRDSKSPQTGTLRFDAAALARLVQSVTDR